MKKPTNNIARIRFLNYLSQKEVAEKLGISQQYYGRLEKNPDKMDIGMARELKGILNLNYIDDLLENAI